MCPLSVRVEAVLANPSSPDVPRLESEIDQLVFDLYNLNDAGREMVLSTCARDQQRGGAETEVDDES